MVLVTGGTGTLGREVVRRLLEDEHEVRVLSRRGRSQGERLPVEWVRGDLKTGEGLGPALSGADTVVHCATAIGSADVAMTRRLTGAARDAGVAHVAYISIVGIDRVPGFSYYRAKAACERIVAESEVPWTVLRTTQFHGLITRAVAAQRRLPVVLTLGGGVPLQPVSEREVGERLAELAVGEPAGRVADMAGPEIRPARDLTRAAVRAARERVLELFPVLADRAHQRAGLLSGGEQQMLAMGRALMAGPRLLLLDEPSLGLSPQMTARIARTVREIHAQGTSVLLVEQNAALALRIATTACVLENGRVALAGDAGELAASDEVRRRYLGVVHEDAAAPTATTVAAGRPVLGRWSE
ncbi:NAD(P)H-binding protein [Streptomyces sp. URMC 129]|uniref:NAD(P)H-binding protein n=1 Tax=Streptomyces sp. URMC 129 TaxID=3423407 RepID=UPI003F1C488D